MVIGYDHVDPDRTGIFGLFHAGDSAVHRDDERNALLTKPVYGVGVYPVALRAPVRDIDLAFQTQALQIIRQQAGRCDAVHIVVPVYGHVLLFGRGSLQSADRRVHVDQRKGIGQQLSAAAQKGPGFVRVVQTAQMQHGCQKRGAPGIRQ